MDAYEENESIAVIERLFPHGFAGQDVLGELAPHEWEGSPLLAVFHPTVEQVYKESLQFHRNVRELTRNKDAAESPEPTLDEVAKSYQPNPIEPEREIRELVGMCLWDIFSDNHEVIDKDGRVVDLGSFRGSAGVIADVMNRQNSTEEYDYIHFYLGTIWVRQRVDLIPVYAMIFRRLNQNDFDWVYHFPKLQVVDLRPLRDAIEQGKQEDWLDYSPERALAKEREDAEREAELARLRGDLDEGNREAMAAALESPPPQTVQAYEAVYGRLPDGWPPTP